MRGVGRLHKGPARPPCRLSGAAQGPKTPSFYPPPTLPRAFCYLYVVHLILFQLSNCTVDGRISPQGALFAASPAGRSAACEQCCCL